MIDWAQTRAFSYGTFGNVIVNVRGRESRARSSRARSTSASGRARGARRWSCASPSGEPIVAAVHRREDLFEGPQLDKVPDLLIEFAEYAWLGKGNVKKRADSLWDTIEVEPGSEHVYVGSHRHEGVFVLAGPSAAQAPARSPRSRTSRRPRSTCSASRCRRSSRAGSSPRRSTRRSSTRARPCTTTASSSSTPSRPQTSYSEGEADEVEARLRGLGYLE